MTRDPARKAVTPYSNFETELNAPPVFSDLGHATSRQVHQETKFHLIGPPLKSKYLALSFRPHSFAIYTAVLLFCNVHHGKRNHDGFNQILLRRSFINSFPASVPS
jgi:hypothetical protein